jgi:uncharacterized membrane protein YagU involved in acid resistance
MRHRAMLKAILLGGLVGGALDLLFAVSFAGANGAAPDVVFHAIASGLLGKAALSGGAAVSALGIASHFCLALLWAAMFAMFAMRFPSAVRRPLLAGAVFGVAVFFSMRLVVLPLSAYPRPVTFKPLATILDLLSHMFLFGTPIALAISRAVRARGADDSSEPSPLPGPVEPGR